MNNNIMNLQRERVNYGKEKKNNNIILSHTVNEMAEFVAPCRVPGYSSILVKFSLKSAHTLSRFLYFVFI